MTDMITRCPACGTSFRITESQLQTAKGAVRCGSCLQIFKALDNLVETATSSATSNTKVTDKKNITPTQNAKPAQNTKPVQVPVKTTPPAAKKTVKPAASKQATAPKPTETKTPPPVQNGLKFDQTAIDTESNASGTLDDINDDVLISDNMDLGEAKSTASNADTLDNTLSDSFLELGTWQPEKKSLFDRELNITEAEESDTADESWAIDLLEELEEEDTDNRTENRGGQDTFEATTEFNDNHRDTFAPIEDEDEVFEAELDYRREPEFQTSNSVEHEQDDFDDNFDRPSVSLRAHQSDRATLLGGIEPAPVEMSWDSGRRLWTAKLRWGLLAGCAALLLVIQLSWFQFDRFSRIEPYRSWYGVICPVFDCHLPTLSSTAHIRAYNLVVRTHPRVENALVIDAILLNTASFDQPFPNLTLSFSKLEGTPLAARTFTRDEYLGGEMTGKTHMPSGQPVHLSLEIADPGKAAVNYSIAITP